MGYDKEQLGRELEEHAKWLSNPNEGKRINWHGRALKWVNLQGVRFQGANLQGTNLEGTNLQGANLEGANLEEVNLEWADL